MFSPPRKIKILGLLCGLFFVGALIQLFLLRFEAGNIYPPYSSLRSDPLGTRALFDSLSRLSATVVGRNFRPWHHVELNNQTSFIITGLLWNDILSEKIDIGALIERQGQWEGRLVITFSPFPGRFKKKNDDAAETVIPDLRTSPSGEKVQKTSVEKNKKKDSFVDLDGLGAKVHFAQIDGIKKNLAIRRAGSMTLLPAEIPWRSPLYFELLDKTWQVLYTWQNLPVVVQRSWGKASVVMVADSYLLSNEALRNHRVPGFLAWLMEPGNEILFDEFNKGMVKQPGIAQLAIKYRLHGLFIGLLVVAVLFVWRQLAIFVPPVRSQQETMNLLPTQHKDTGQGMVHLMRQHISPQQLLTVCFKAWKSQAAQNLPRSLIHQVKALVLESAGDSRKDVQINSYKKICELLKQGRRS